MPKRNTLGHPLNIVFILCFLFKMLVRSCKNIPSFFFGCVQFSNLQQYGDHQKMIK